MNDASDTGAGPVHLSTALAQRIVDDLAPALNENLNLMDADGFIVASRDVSRVGTLHPGAREAATTNAAVEIGAATARPGERPGVNLPLLHRGRVVGVVGVTGEPERVRSLASVLVHTIALLVDREAELVGESHRDAADRDVLARLVYGSRPEEALTSLAKRHPPLPGPWVLFASMGDAHPDSGALESAVRLRRTLAAPDSLAFGLPALVGSLRGVMWVLISLGSGSHTLPSQGDTFQALVSEVSALLPGALIVHSGVCVSGAELIREASGLALLSTRADVFGVRIGGPGAINSPISGRVVYATRQLRLRIAAAHLPRGVAESLAEVLANVSPDERETLRAYLKSGNAAELGRSGFTHRNTVQRRLKSIEARTGYDLRIPADAAVLVLALAAFDETAVR